MRNNQIEFLDILTILSTALQVMNSVENQQQASNNDIIREINAQNQRYLEQIIKKLEILEQFLLGGSMYRSVEEKYNDLKIKHPDLDTHLVELFIRYMPEEAMITFNKFEYGCHIVEEGLYNEAIKTLKWVEDKGSGAKWSLDDIIKLSNIDFDKKKYHKRDYAYVVNMLYSDYCNIFSEPSYYLKMARNYLEDPDYAGDASERAYHNAMKRIAYYKHHDGAV